MNKQELLLLVLDIGGSLSPIQLQKTLFLIGTELSDIAPEEFYEFAPYDYGPFNPEIYSDVEILSLEGLAQIDNPLMRGWRRYGLTGEGTQKAREIADALDPELLDRLEEKVAWVKKQSFTSLVRSIYEKYPEYSVNSVFKGSSSE